MNRGSSERQRTDSNVKEWMNAFVKSDGIVEIFSRAERPRVPILSRGRDRARRLSSVAERARPDHLRRSVNLSAATCCRISSRDTEGPVRLRILLAVIGTLSRAAR